jgi:hypothetical protein
MLFREMSACSKTSEARKYSQWAVDRFFNYEKVPNAIVKKTYGLRDYQEYCP